MLTVFFKHFNWVLLAINCTLRSGRIKVEAFSVLVILSVSHPAVDLKSKETISFCAILVGCIESSAHPVADHQAADSWSSEESVAAALWE